MKMFKIILTIILLIIAYSIPAKAVDYPIISIGVNGGWGENELKDGFFMRAFLRYSLEAYIPGFQVEAGFAPSFFNTLEKEEINDPDPDTALRTTEQKMRDSYATFSGAFHFNPFGKQTVLYVGGGINLNFLLVRETVTEKYWDQEGEKYQELEVEATDLFKKTVPGFHALGGLRFVLGKFGSLDLEARQTFITVEEMDWDEKVREKYGSKSWDNLNFNVGLTIFIF